MAMIPGQTQGISTKQKKSRLFGLLISLGVFLIVIAIMAVIQVTPYAVYQNQAAGIRLKYPAYWKMIDHPENRAIVGFVTPQQNAMDTFYENVNITVYEITAVSKTSLSLAQFSQMVIRQLTGTFENEIEVVESDSARLAGRPAYRFSYIAKVPKSPLKIMHVWVIAGTKAYIFTYSAAQKDFDVFRGEVTAMLKSFTIL